jgi:hypothetical protein
VRYAYEAAARFEMSEAEALARVASASRAYDRAFATLSKESRAHAEDMIPRTVPVFRDLWRGNYCHGNGGRC